MEVWNFAIPAHFSRAFSSRCPSLGALLLPFETPSLLLLPSRLPTLGSCPSIPSFKQHSLGASCVLWTGLSGHNQGFPPYRNSQATKDRPEELSWTRREPPFGGGSSEDSISGSGGLACKGSRKLPERFLPQHGVCLVAWLLGTPPVSQVCALLTRASPGCGRQHLT